jgi:NAD(P)-dependent dehydrogenase (short-subunit alcohol dehydrogenase family)
LKNKVTLITGAGSGLGSATALLFAREGARVVVADVDTHAGNGIVQKINGTGGDAFFVEADVSQAADAERMITAAVQKYGRLDVLFNNAGIAEPMGTVEEISEESWDRIINVNLKGVFLGSKYAIPVMAKQGGGVIINMASVNGLFAIQRLCAYNASKGGVIMLTKSMAIDHAHEKIRVNCICPGVVRTPMIEKYIRESANPDEALKEQENLNFVIKRLIEPEEVASMALFLASDEASAVTGGSYVVDGGYTAI